MSPAPGDSPNTVYPLQHPTPWNAFRPSQMPNTIGQCTWLLPSSFQKPCSFLLKKLASFICVKADKTLTSNFWEKLGSIIGLSSNPLFHIMIWDHSEVQSSPGLQKHMKSHWSFAITGYSSLTPYSASLTQPLKFWNLIHAQACCAACTHHLLKEQAPECCFDGNVIVLAYLNINILLP